MGDEELNTEKQPKLCCKDPGYSESNDGNLNRDTMPAHAKKHDASMGDIVTYRCSSKRAF